jgi:antitoxin component YwqK of YwqJK toxin-antitoxin module
MITREKRNLTGSVQRIETNFAVFEIIDGNPIETRHQSAGYSIYDPEGKLIEEVCPYRLLMNDAYKDIYIYDARGQLTEREEYDVDGLLNGKTVFDRIDDNYRVEKHYYIDTQGILKLGSHTIYDSEDEAVETTHYDENGNVVPEKVYKFAPSRKIRKNNLPDGDGYAVEEFRHNENDNLTDRTVTTYDSKGNQK